MRKRKFELSSWLVYEAGKNWAEADADTAEAIFWDFTDGKCAAWQNHSPW